MRTRRIHCLGAVALLAATACGARPAAPPVVIGQEHDVCEGSAPLPHAPLAGVLRNARCDQDLYYSMSQVMDMLGVDCTYCHAAKVEGQPERDFPASTPRKEIANWMSGHLMQAVKRADGAPMKCSACHTDEQGRPVAKILGNPRDRSKASEWMSLVLVKKFVAADGSRLKCKSCHVGTPGTPEYRPVVILKTDQLPRHEAGAKGTAAF